LSKGILDYDAGCFAIYKIYRRISGYKVSTLTKLDHSRYWFISWDYYAI